MLMGSKKAKSHGSEETVFPGVNRIPQKYPVTATRSYPPKKSRGSKKPGCSPWNNWAFSALSIRCLLYRQAQDAGTAADHVHPSYQVSRQSQLRRAGRRLCHHPAQCPLLPRPLRRPPPPREGRVWVKGPSSESLDRKAAQGQPLPHLGEGLALRGGKWPVDLCAMFLLCLAFRAAAPHRAPAAARDL